MPEERKKKKNLFENEINILKASKIFLAKENITLEEYRDHLTSLNQDYEDLVDQSKLITKVSDRLQKKINRVNDELGDKNVALQESLDALTKAKVGRKATTIVLVIFIVVFIVDLVNITNINTITITMLIRITIHITIAITTSTSTITSTSNITVTTS